MTETLKTAWRYFDLSNQSNFAGIEALFTDSTTYSSPAAGIYLGRRDIMAMQQVFHGQFSSLRWEVNSMEEVKPGIALFDYNFTAEMPNSQKIKTSGLEYVIVYEGKIQHIEIKAKENQ